MSDRRSRIALAALAGFISGALVLGIGGRMAMRILTLTLDESGGFSLKGTVAIVVFFAVSGAITGPILLLMDGLRARIGRGVGLVFGALALVLVMGPFMVLISATGEIVAPTAFVALATLLFVVLFLAHGTMVDTLVRRWPKRASQSFDQEER